MKISLILATLGRTIEVEKCLNSFVEQKHELEIIIVDQNADNRLEMIVKKYKTQLNIIYIHSDKRGLSYNRNIGFKYATGDIIGFPDDDCIYPDSILDIVCLYLNKYDFISFNIKDLNVEKSIPLFPVRKTQIHFFNFLSVGCSPSFFVKRNCINSFKFDEKLGVGAAFGSAEETDMLFFLLNQKYKCYYDGTYYISHPQMDYEAIKDRDKRNYTYALGFGAFFKKCVLNYHNYLMLFVFGYSLMRSWLGWLFRNKHAYWLVIKGRVRGFIQYR